MTDESDVDANEPIVTSDVSTEVERPGRPESATWLVPTLLTLLAACGSFGWPRPVPDAPVVRRTVVESHTTTQAEGSPLTVRSEPPARGPESDAPETPDQDGE